MSMWNYILQSCVNMQPCIHISHDIYTKLSFVFKSRVDEYWHNQEIVYDFRAQLQRTGSRSEVSSYE